MRKHDGPAQPDGKAEPLSANERFKRSFTTYFWGALILATGAHFAVFDFWPAMTAVDVSSTTGELTAIELPPEIQIPEPPEVIPRPAVPVVVPGVMDEDLTIPLTTFQANPVADLPAPPPPPNEALGNLADAPVFTPYTVRPSILNREEVTRALEREYPSLLRDAGIGGTVLVWFFIDEEGTAPADAGARELGSPGPGRGGPEGGGRHPVQPGPESGQAGAGVDLAAHHLHHPVRVERGMGARRWGGLRGPSSLLPVSPEDQAYHHRHDGQDHQGGRVAGKVAQDFPEGEAVILPHHSQ
jgi:hypothetical protein